MKHIKTLNGATLKNSAAHGGCGECQTSCQSACKTSCTVANQKCENNKSESGMVERVGAPHPFSMPWRFAPRSRDPGRSN